MTLNIVIPVLNEENSLQLGVENTIKFLIEKQMNNKCIITIVDNGSTDQTEEIAQKLCYLYSNVNYLKVSQRGVGLAFREAIKKNTSDIIGYMDVDLATDIKHLCQVYQSINSGVSSIVVGSRLLCDSKVYNRSLLREITSRGLNLILKIILKVHFTDAMCGFKFYRSDIAEKLVVRCSESNGWFYCAEMLICAEWEQIKITEIPVEWHDDSNSKVKVGKLSMNYMSEIIKLYKMKKRTRN